MSQIPFNMISAEKISTDASSPPVKLTPELLAELRAVLEIDLIGCDAKWMLFVAAAFNPQFIRKLYPIPPFYISKTKGFVIDELHTTINNTPQLRIVLIYLKEENYFAVNAEVLQLLHWVLVKSRGSRLRLLSEKSSNDLLDQIRAAQIEIPQRPTHILEVYTCNQYSDLPPTDASIEFAFYGDRLEQFYSILQRGIVSLMDRQEPTIMLKDLVSALQQSPSGAGWGFSECGSLVSCVAICACIKPFQNDSDSEDNSQNDDDKLYSGFIDVRYLFLFGKRSTDLPI